MRTGSARTQAYVFGGAFMIGTLLIGVSMSQEYAFVVEYITALVDGAITSSVVQKKSDDVTNQLRSQTQIREFIDTANLDEIKEILETEGVYRILIDNFNYEDTRTAVQLIGNQCLTESSGGINEKTVRNYAECGVDFISSGALTHSVYNMDLSLKAV